jgi:1-deoxy-D-xylulose-5-phosphate reductoisomerase
VNDVEQEPVNGPVGIAVLGSTGSVGRQTLEVVAAHPSRFRVVALAARSPSALLEAQVAHFSPDLVAISEQANPRNAIRYVSGSQGLVYAATHREAEIVVVATSGHAAINATLAAIECGKVIALANKETLVCAGELIVPLAAKHGAQLRPVDSEHSAIWQALAGTPTAQVRRLILTASGGPFRTTPLADLVHVTVQQAMSHPTWSMGEKITVDSATMMNKGLELIEAHWLFDMPYSRIDVIVHAESIVHSLVEFIDGSMIAQLGLPDMRLPIQYALAYPERLESYVPQLRLADVAALHFEAPDEDRFPALRIAREAGVAGSTFPTVLSAADDVAVDAFVAGKLQFMDIPLVVSEVLSRHQPAPGLSLEAVWLADEWARREAQQVIGRR